MLSRFFLNLRKRLNILEYRNVTDRQTSNSVRLSVRPSVCDRQTDEQTDEQNCYINMIARQYADAR